jgi:hypothetical protein
MEVNIPVCLATGVCPDLSSFLPAGTWCAGRYIVVLNRDFKSNLTVMQKVAFLSGMLYWITALGSS